MLRDGRSAQRHERRRTALRRQHCGAAASESLSGRGFVGLQRFARTFFQERRSPPNFATAVAPPLAGDSPGRHEPRDRLHGRPRVATNFENARQLLSAISSTRASLRGASGLPLSQCRGTRPQSRLPQMPSHRLRRRRQRGNHRAGPSLSSITLRRPLLSGTCLQLHGHTGGGEGLEVRNWHAWRCRHYRRAVLHAHVRHKHRRAGRRRARRWQVAAGLQAAVPSSAALRCSRRPSPPPSAPGNRSRARRLSSPGHGGGGSSSRWQCLLASVCRRARFAARVPTLLSTSMR